MDDELDPVSDKVWSFEETIKIEKDKLRIFFRLAIFDDPPSIVNIKRDFATVCNCFHWSKTKAVTTIFIVGLKVLVEACGVEDSYFNPQYLARQSKLALLKQRQEEQTQLREIYKEMGLEGFREWCQETGHDAESFLSGFSFLAPISKGDKIGEFLTEYLSDNELHQTVDIKQALIRDGIIDNDSGWQYAKTVANREGYTKNCPKGYWKISSEIL